MDFGNVLADSARIREVLPHRHEFALLDALVYRDDQAGIFAGYHDIKPDAWWTRAHIPGRPLFPGVLMIEVAAQLASFLMFEVLKDVRFIGFAGIDSAKFRDVVEPPARLLVVAKAVQVKPRRIVCDCQGFVGDTMVFEARIAGMPV